MIKWKCVARGRTRAAYLVGDGLKQIILTKNTGPRIYIWRDKAGQAGRIQICRAGS